MPRRRLATLIGLLPPAGTKFIIDYGLRHKPLPAPWLRLFPSLANPRQLLLVTVVAVSVVSLVKIVIQVWGRWYATKISKQIQLDVRRRVFEHAVRLPLHRVQEIRSGGVASILREDGGSVGELMFGMLFNPWRAIIQLIGSLAILAWVDWTLLLGALVLLPTVFVTHRAWINNIRPQFRVIRKQREQIDAGATESFAGMRIVRAFSRQKREAARFTTENNLMARQELYAWWWMRAVETVWEALIPIASAGLLFYGGLARARWSHDRRRSDDVSGLSVDAAGTARHACIKRNSISKQPERTRSRARSAGRIARDAVHAGFAESRSPFDRRAHCA